MKKHFSCGSILAAFLIGLMPATTAMAQGNCVLGAAKASVESGNIKTMLMNGGDMFWDLLNPNFEVPKGSGKHSIFAGGIWFGGIDQSISSPYTSILLSSQTYRQNLGGIPQKGYWPGPASATIDAYQCSLFDFISKITAQDITTFNNRVLLGLPVPEAEIPEAVKLWPGRGNPFMSNISNMGAGPLAPFLDLNNDGIYDPRDGDSPIVPGDEALFTIINDFGNTKQPLTQPFPLEAHIMMYGFNAPASPDIQNTIFARYTFFNRGSKTLTDTYFAQWVDLNIGHYLDDYIGSDVGLNMFYGYNGDNDDEGPYGYGINPPAQGVVFLNVPMTNVTFYHNNASPLNGNPLESLDFYNYMRSKWRNGIPITYGGDGSGGTTPATHMFDGDPVAGTGWTEASAGNLPGERRGLGAHGPFTFGPGESKTFDVAFPWARGNSNLNSLTELRQAVGNLHQFYHTVLSAPGTVSAPALALQLYPNPTEGAVQVQLSGAATGEATFTLRDLTGRTMLQEKVLLPAGQSQHRLQLGQLPKGLYLLQVQRGAGSQTVKVVRQ